MRFLGVLSVLLLLSVSACAQEGEVVFDQGRVILSGSQDQRIILEVEIADTDDTRSHGLMYRKSLPEGQGMVFLWDKSGMIGMWMKNTYIPLDMIFAQDEKIVGFAENVEPMTEKIRSADKPVNRVLEVPAGFIKKHGINKNWRMQVTILD